MIKIKDQSITFFYSNVKNNFYNYVDDNEFLLIGKASSSFKISNKVIEYFKLEKIIDKKIKSLEELCYLTIINNLQKSNKLIIVNLFNLLNNLQKEKIIKYLKTNRITTLITSVNPEDMLLADQVVVKTKNKILTITSFNKIYLYEKFLKDEGIYLPFVIDLSIQLKLYDLIDKIYYKEEKLIGDLWK